MQKQVKTWAEKHILLEHACRPIVPACETMENIDRHIIVRFLINTAIQCNKFNIQSFFSYNIKAKQYELYLSLGNISVYNRNCNNVFCY